MTRVALLICLALALPAPLPAQGVEGSRNRPARLEWFRDMGVGLFIHWSLDAQIGSVISHSLVGASEDYARRFFEVLPRSFNPRKFHPEDWAVLARLAGMKYERSRASIRRRSAGCSPSSSTSSAAKHPLLTTYGEEQPLAADRP